MTNTFLSDTMTGANWSDLHNHTAEVGGKWARHSSTPSTRWYIFGNKVHCGVPGMIYSPATPASANVTVECDYTMYSDTASISIACRVNTANLTFYYLYYLSGELVLAKQVNGVITTLGTDASGLMSNGNTYRLKLSAIGTTISSYVNGVLIDAATDSSIVSAGKVGVRSAGSNDAGTGKHIDNLIAYDDTTAAVTKQRFTGFVG